MDLGRIILAISTTSSRETLPVCLMFFVFLRSRSGSLRALMTSAAAEGTTETLAWRFCTVSFTVTRRPFQSLAVSLAMSSPIFFGERPRGPILGASELAAPTSPPVTRTKTSTTWVGSNLGGIVTVALRLRKDGEMADHVKGANLYD
ncbi:3-isopropylmalate dehydrogenase [Bertholletia excelsa]